MRESSIKAVLVIFLGLLVTIFVIYFLQFIFLYCTPFLLGVILAGFFNPLVNYLEQRILISRGFIVGLVLLLHIFLILVIFVFGFARIYMELNHFISHLPADYDTLREQTNWILQQNRQLKNLFHTYNLPESLLKSWKINLPLLYEEFYGGLFFLVNRIFAVLKKLPFLIIMFFLSVVVSFFVSRDYKLITAFILEFFPEKYRVGILKFRDELIYSVLRYFRAQMIMVSFSGVFTALGLLAANFHYYVIFGAIVAVLDLIPVIGPALIFYPFVLYNLLSGNINFAIYLLCLYTSLVFIRYGVEGKVIGRGLGVHPLSVMLALYTGFRFLGVTGLFVGPAFLIIVKALFAADLIKIGEWSE
ncbi:MAG: sporulation integral membrane protein YtvI [Bacillota bacterium]